jgi:hypothetical protein
MTTARNETDYVEWVKRLQHDDEKPELSSLPATPWAFNASNADKYRTLYDQHEVQDAATLLLMLVIHRIRFPKTERVKSWSEAFVQEREAIWWWAFGRDVSRGRKVISYRFNPLGQDECVSEEYREARDFVIKQYGVEDKTWELPERQKPQPNYQPGTPAATPNVRQYTLRPARAGLTPSRQNEPPNALPALPVATQSDLF